MAGPLPYSVEVTYNNGSLPAIDGDNLNSIQKAIVDLAAAQRGRDFLFDDDFTGSALDTGKWIITVGGTGIAETFNDAGGGDGVGSDGAAHLSSGGVTGNAEINTWALNRLGLNDFHFSAWMRVAQIGGGTSEISLGLPTLGKFEQRADTNAGKFCVNLNGVRHNTAFVSDGDYHFFEVRRTAGVFEFLIENNIVYTEILALSAADVLLAEITNNTSGATHMYVDSMKLWHRR